MKKAALSEDKDRAAFIHVVPDAAEGLFFDLEQVDAFFDLDAGHLFVEFEFCDYDLRKVQDLGISFQMRDDRGVMVLP